MNKEKDLVEVVKVAIKRCNFNEIYDKIEQHLCELKGVNEGTIVCAGHKLYEEIFEKLSNCTLPHEVIKVSKEMYDLAYAIDDINYLFYDSMSKLLHNISRNIEKKSEYYSNKDVIVKIIKKL